MSHVPRLNDLVQMWIDDEHLPLIMFRHGDSDEVYFICVNQSFYSPSPPWLSFSTMEGDYPITGILNTVETAYHSAYHKEPTFASQPDFFEWLEMDILHVFSTQDLDRSKLPEQWRTRLNSVTSSETGPKPETGPSQ